MNYVDVGGVRSSKVVIGGMRYAGKPLRQIEEIIIEALKAGANTFDHADIYGKGDSETVFGLAMKDLEIPRESLVLQTKCGICDGYYDLSREHILASVENSAKRMNTDYLDILLLHRPDSLMEPDEIYEAFDILQSEGKVRAFGVSNFSPAQIEMMRSAGIRVSANQVQLSLMHSPIIDEGLSFNMENAEGLGRTQGLLEYCRKIKIVLQAWSPLAYGFIEGVFVGNESFPALNAELFRLAEKYSVTPAAIAIAWILRHPAGMQAVVGSTSPERIGELCKATDVTLTREEWYALYRAAGKRLP
ncbi:MAG: aldo/keto reductase [Clostridia bacterium]|nr:aldo/keto reductase [Clostridia bacterium]